MTRRIRLVGRWTIRARLTLTYTALLVGVAALMAGGVYLFMSLAPTYDFPSLTPVAAAPSLATTTQAEPVESSTLDPLVIQSKGDVLTTLLIGSAAALALTAGLAGAFGWLVTGRLLRPLHEITTAARLAGAGHLDHRIARPGPPDELKDLADTFDVMLARLELSMHTYRRFAANASHELRTPLATTQALLDLAITDPEDQDVRALARKLRTINSRSIDTVDALFDLADAAESDIRREPVPLRELAGQALGAVADEDYDGWYAELFGPSVTAGILKPSELAGFRNGPVYIRRSMHVPPNSDAVRELMPAFFDLLKAEVHAAVRVVLGHFMFVWIHPYFDGNGRMGRFMMNTMLASGGYPWTIVPLDRRADYMSALESASVDQDVGPLSRFLAELVTKQP